jgi:TIR domain
MPSEFAFDVFLSHNSEDKPRVRRLAERLKAAGLRVWFDEWSISPGEHIGLAIERGLEASRILVLFLSPAALGSDWVHLERGTALFRDPVNKQRRFLPVLLRDCALPEALRPFKYIDLRKDNKRSFARLVVACKEETLPAVSSLRDKRIKLFVLPSLSIAGLLLIWLLVELGLFPDFRKPPSLLVRPSPTALGTLEDGAASLRVLVRTRKDILVFTSKPCPGPHCPRRSYLIGNAPPITAERLAIWGLDLSSLDYSKEQLEYAQVLREWQDHEDLAPSFKLAPDIEMRIELITHQKILACKELSAKGDLVDVFLTEELKCDSPSTRWHS